MSEEEGERGFSGRVRKMGSGRIGGRQKRESPASCSITGSDEEGGFFWDCPLFKKYGLLLAKNKNKWALRWIGFCIGPVSYPCFLLEGLNTRGSPLETLPALQLIAHSKGIIDASSLIMAPHQ